LRNIEARVEDEALEVGAGCVHSRAALKRAAASKAAMITRTTKITIETEGTLAIRQSRTVVAWCPECQAEVEVLPLEDASLLQLLAGLRGGLLHVCRQPGSPTQICLPSLLRLSQSTEVQQPSFPERKLTQEGEEQ
jgi:hypothetical protein